MLNCLPRLVTEFCQLILRESWFGGRLRSKSLEHMGSNPALIPNVFPSSCTSWQGKTYNLPTQVCHPTRIQINVHLTELPWGLNKRSLGQENIIKVSFDETVRFDQLLSWMNSVLMLPDQYQSLMRAIILSISRYCGMSIVSWLAHEGFSVCVNDKKTFQE